MTGRAYYLTTLGAWRRHVLRFAHSHWLAVNGSGAAINVDDRVAKPLACPEAAGALPGMAVRDDKAATRSLGPPLAAPSGVLSDAALDGGPTDAAPLRAGPLAAVNGDHCTVPSDQATPPVGAVRERPVVHNDDPDDTTQILVLIDADEGTHNSLEQDAEWEPLPHPLSLKPVSDNLQSALKGQGIAPGATTFDVAELLARAHPLLRHRVF